MQRPSVLTARPRIRSLPFGKVGPAGAAFGFFVEERLAMFPIQPARVAIFAKSYRRYRDRTTNETARHFMSRCRFCRSQWSAHAASDPIVLKNDWLTQYNCRFLVHLAVLQRHQFAIGEHVMDRSYLNKTSQPLENFLGHHTGKGSHRRTDGVYQSIRRN
jgi:hypothetical protein